MEGIDVIETREHAKGRYDGLIQEKNSLLSRLHKIDGQLDLLYEKWGVGHGGGCVQGKEN